MIQVRVLGTGTSTGVPIPCCNCSVCSSDNPRNQRLRPSIYLEWQAEESKQGCGVLIDTTPDLRQQALRYGISRVDSVLITHTHADHIFGMDDLRGFNFSQKSSIPIYASRQSAEVLSSIFHYCFYPDPSYQGGAPPSLQLMEIRALEAIELHGRSILALPLLHGNSEVFGFRFGRFAYATDCSSVPEESRAQLTEVRTLILDGLRFREHPTHFSLEQACDFALSIGVERCYLTHLSHEVDYDEGNHFLEERSGGRVQLAYDGLAFEEEWL